MDEHEYTVEELMLDESFKSYCLNTDTNNTYHWQTIINDHPEQAGVFEEAKNLIISLNGGLDKSEINRQIEKVRRLLNERNKIEPEGELVYEPSLSDNYVVTETGNVKRLIRRRIIAYAVAACLVGFVAYLFVYQVKPANNAPNQLATTSFQTPLGRRQTVSLPDGSLAILNSNSSLSYTGNFNKSKREIELKGDAFFKVAKNPAKPFIVRSGNISTTALGTEFFVQSHQPETKGITVDLLEGKVSVASSKNSPGSVPIILLPGEKAKTYDGININKERFDTTWMHKWIKGEIVFSKTPVLLAIRQLEQWYDVKININKQSLENQTITGEYQHAELMDVLQVICFTINRKFTVSGNEIIIK